MSIRFSEKVQRCRAIRRTLLKIGSETAMRGSRFRRIKPENNKESDAL